MKRKRIKSLISLLLTIALVFSMAMPVSAAGQPILTVTHNQSESIQKGDGTVDVVYTITLDPNGNQVAAFQFTLEAPNGMTLATNKLKNAEENKGGAGYWIAAKALEYDEDEETGIFEAGFKYTPATGVFLASGGVAGRTLDSEATIMTIQATLDISEVKTYSLGVSEFKCAAVGSASLGGQTPIVDDVKVIAPHTHVYDQQVSTDDYKVSGATCTSPAVYYYSCTCGMKDSNATYQYGQKLGHDYTQQIQDAAHLKTEATNCTEYNVYWYDCARCDVNAKDDANASDKYYSSTIAGDHVFTEKIEDASHLVNGSGADCQNAKKYYFDCEYCATIGTNTWTSSSVGGHIMSQEYTQLNNQHFKVCTVNGCDHTSTPENCSGGTATCSAKAICSVCSNTYGDFASHVYTAQTVKAEALVSEANCKSAAVYYYSCTVCGHVEGDANHTFTNGGTDANNHVGSTTLINAAPANHETQQDGYTGDTKCDDCKEIIAYGQKIPASEHHEPSTWTTDDAQHWKVCDVNNCGVEIANTRGNHTSTGENKATCQNAAECDVCGVSYGSVGSHDMATGNEWSKDATGHWYECKTSGCTEKTGFAAHTPNHQGGATEEYAIECTECGFEIEAQLGHTHVYDKEVAAKKYRVSSATCQEYAVYKRSCKCGTAGTETFEDVNAGYADHKWNTAWTKDETGHWHTCKTSGCTETADFAAHTPDHEGGATEDYAVKCEVCKYVIEDMLPHEHTPGEAWKRDKNNHWHICEKEGCGAVIAESKEAHTDADNNKKCDVCEYQMKAEKKNRDEAVGPYGWLNMNGKWYFYDAGKKLTGWRFVRGHWYFFKKTYPDYAVMQTGWLLDENKWYFLNENGTRKTGWFFDPNYNAWYYLHDINGDMLVNTTTPDGYYVGEDGKWVQ